VPSSAAAPESWPSDRLPACDREGWMTVEPEPAAVDVSLAGYRMCRRRPVRVTRVQRDAAWVEDAGRERILSRLGLDRILRRGYPAVQPGWWHQPFRLAYDAGPADPSHSGARRAGDTRRRRASPTRRAHRPPPGGPVLRMALSRGPVMTTRHRVGSTNLAVGWFGAQAPITDLLME
jgi:hypothetical protein